MQAASKLIEEIQLDLQSLDEEEDNLLMLKGQLSKLRKIREEQSRKDEMISALKERVTALEKEQLFWQRQNKELQDIMADRISELEKSLQGKDEIEQQCVYYQAKCMGIQGDYDSILSDHKVLKAR